MIRPDIVWCIARAETRLTRRLVRYWLFQALAGVVGVAGILYYGFLHRMFSAVSGTVGLLNPRYLFGFIGIYYLVGFLLGLVFLGYDIRARDERERVVEVLDAMPCSNLELLLGRFLGILIPCWVPVPLISLVMMGVSAAMGSSIEPFSMLTFIVFMTLPAYCFVLGLVFFLTLVLKHRLLAGVVLVAILVGLVVVNFAFVPVYMLPLVDITGGFSVPGPSDIIPGIIDGRGLLQRLSYALAGLAFLWLAAAVHPRRDDTARSRNAAVGLAMLLVAAAIAGGLVRETRAAITQQAAWRDAHEARKDDALPDVLRLAGEVRLDKTLEMNLELRFRAREQPLETALFSLNPGLIVESATDGAGHALEIEQADGLLSIRLPRRLAPGAEGTLQLVIAGRPNEWFGYLDAVLNPLSLNIQEGNIFLLGFINWILEPRFAALLPGIRWLPASGTEFHRGDPRQHPTDFYEVDLTVDVPEDWLVAGPGRRQAVGGAASGRVRFRFAPGAPVPDVALVGGRFVSRSIEVGGVTLEVLVHPRHEPSLETFADAAGDIGEWLTDRLEEVQEFGLGYPYDGLTLVEVPNVLRGYGGGWRMDTTYSQPAMVLMREAGFPTARFDVPFEDEDGFRDREGGVGRAKRELLERFFENDLSGGNPFLAASRSFFGYQTAAEGSMGLPLDYVFEDLSNRLVTEKQGYFSVHHYGKDLGQTVTSTIQAVFQGASVSGALIDHVTQRNEVWSSVLESSLENLNPWEAPMKALDVLTLKGGAMSRSLFDSLGPRRAGQVLAALRERGAGGSFDPEDVLAAGAEVGEDLEPWLDLWIRQTDLPGFSVGQVRYERLTDSDDGSPRYQLVLTLANGEPTPGLVRVDYRTAREKGRSKWELGEPLQIAGEAAVEFGLVTSEPLDQLRVSPYLALNRAPFSVALPALDEERSVEAEPFDGVREAQWVVIDDGSIVVDDLDAGFSADEPETRQLLRVGGKTDAEEETDGGLPVDVGGVANNRWTRVPQIDAFGKYRHTMARIRKGKGDRLAVFKAEIPHAGEWELEYYLTPSGVGRRKRSRGIWKLQVVDPSGRRDVTFDADGGEAGWNSLGTFEIADGSVRVEVSNEVEGKGRYVIADAIRWSPVAGRRAAQP